METEARCESQFRRENSIKRQSGRLVENIILLPLLDLYMLSYLLLHFANSVLI